MNVLIVLALATVASAQLGGIFGNVFGWNSDHLHGYSFEFHKRHHLLIMKNAHECHLVDVSNHDIEEKLKDDKTRKILEEEVYAQVMAHTGEAKVHLHDIRNKYHDIPAVIECLRHTIYELTLTAPK